MITCMKGNWPLARPCPICRKSDRCKIAPDGATVLCFRIAEGCYRPAKGEVGWLHWVVENRPSQRITKSNQEQTSSIMNRADDNLLDSVYSHLLQWLPLFRQHRNDLRRRGLSDDAIERNGYASLPDDMNRRRRAVAGLQERFGHDIFRVPGIAPRTNANGRCFPALMGWPGLIVPVRDLTARVVGLKVRLDHCDGGNRYQLLSRMGGPSNCARVHVPLGTPTTCRSVIVLEGELKSDVCVHLYPSGVYLSIPGVTTWNRVMPFLQDLGAEEVIVAFDADYDTNPSVGLNLQRFRTALQHDYCVLQATWNPALGKGLDDVLSKFSPSKIKLR